MLNFFSREQFKEICCYKISTHFCYNIVIILSVSWSAQSASMMLSLFALMVVVLWLATFFSSSPYERFCQIDIFPHWIFFLHQRISKRQKASPSIGSLMAASFLLYIYAPLVVWALFPHRLKKKRERFVGLHMWLKYFSISFLISLNVLLSRRHWFEGSFSIH